MADVHAISLMFPGVNPEGAEELLIESEDDSSFCLATRSSPWKGDLAMVEGRDVPRGLCSISIPKSNCLAIQYVRLSN